MADSYSIKSLYLASPFHLLLASYAASPGKVVKGLQEVGGCETNGRTA
jgi:hypothetical protein